IRLAKGAPHLLCPFRIISPKEFHQLRDFDQSLISRVRTNVRRRTSKMTAVDHPNSNMPFIAVRGPTSRQLSTGKHIAIPESRVVHERKIHEIGSRGRHIEYQVRQSPYEYFDYMRSHQNRDCRDHHYYQNQRGVRLLLRAHGPCNLNYHCHYINAWIAMVIKLTPPPTRNCRNMPNRPRVWCT